MAETAEKVLVRLGRRIAELRARQPERLTQEELAERLGVTPRYVQSIEAGRQNLSVRSLVKLADALGTNVPHLFKFPRKRTVTKGRPRTARAR